MSTVGASRRLHWKGLRYVDNLLTIHIRRRDGTITLPQTLHNERFYGGPMILESEPAMDFLGMEIIVRENAIMGELLVPGYREITQAVEEWRRRLLHECRWRYRGPHAAGTFTHTYTGVKSRLHIAARLPFPISNARRAIVQLLTVFTAMGFSQRELQRIIVSHHRQYPIVYCTKLQEQVKEALSRPRLEAIERLRMAVGYWARDTQP